MLQHPDLIMNLCSSQDMLVRFSLQRLVSSMLCMVAPKGDRGHNLFALQVALLDKIVATLLSTHHNTDTTVTVDTRQLLLEICHWVLKDARKYLKAMQISGGQHESTQFKHVGLILQERMQVASNTTGTAASPASSVASCVAHWLQCPMLCYPTLVFLIDIEKNARMLHTLLFQPSGLIHQSCLTSQCMDQLLDLSKFKPTSLRRVLQLLFIHLRPPPSPDEESTASQQEQDYKAQGVNKDHWTSPQENVKILQSLVPYAARLRQILASPESKQFLRQTMSNIHAPNTTHFVAMQSLSAVSQRHHLDPHWYFAQCALQDPETLRGLIRVFSQVALNGLRGLLFSTSPDVLPATTWPHSQKVWAQVFDSWIEHIADFFWHGDWIAASQTLLNPHRFQDDDWSDYNEGNDNIFSISNNNNSSSSSESTSHIDAGQLFWKTAFHLFGEDDADVAWLLHTTLDLTRKLEAIVRQLRSTTTTPRYLRVSNMTQSRLIELLLFFREGESLVTAPADAPFSTSTTSTTTTSSRHVFWGIHSLDGFFFFLQTIGHDPQTVVDLLLSVDHQELGGFLAVTVSLLRHYTSLSPSPSLKDLSNRERLLDRWQRMTLGTKPWLYDGHDEEDEEAYHEKEYVNNKDGIKSRIGHPTGATTAAARQLPMVGDQDLEPHGADAEAEDEGEGEDDHSMMTTLARAHFCLHEVLTKLQALARQDLLPFNPRTLICVLKEFTDMMDTFLTSLTEQ
ncbi:hypothetical protein DFQ27_008584 [Actinomortierella ambigua]|uniref:Uncharacterized protein n=1 Tax=Actinomortierella ambigua TaxID=1343610 RepID=A0A9P6PR43_9FUNG|nr:hypothetical protein DFQ27_008584 [Actinomortierella ambigua]